MPRNPFDRTVPAGKTPVGQGFMVPPRGGAAPGAQGGAAPGPLGAFFGRLAEFFLGNSIYVTQVPFKYWVASSIVMTLGVDNWIDQRNFLQGRRGFAVVNEDPTLGNDIWINSMAMRQNAQGGRVFAQGGTFYGPIGYGADQQQVHVWPSVAATSVSFYQFG